MALAACGSARSGARVDAAAGRPVFADACSACHSLSGTHDPQLQGGDLLHFHASRHQMTQLTREMPVPHPLTRSQLRAVVSFVIDAERGRAPG